MLPGRFTLRQPHERTNVESRRNHSPGLVELERLSLGLRTRLIGAQSASKCIGLGSRSLALRARNTPAPPRVQFAAQTLSAPTALSRADSHEMMPFLGHGLSLNARRGARRGPHELDADPAGRVERRDFADGESAELQVAQGDVDRPSLDPRPQEAQDGGGAEDGQLLGLALVVVDGVDLGVGAGARVERLDLAREADRARLGLEASPGTR